MSWRLKKTDLQNTIEVRELRKTLTSRYPITKSPGTISRNLLPYVETDPEVYLWCLMWEDTVKFNEKKLFAVRFKYPNIVEVLMKELGCS